jgi:polysaccharide chain length determinant protein (PEP-CTERM system associated)
MREFFEKLWDEVSGAWRFRWIAMITAWVVALVGWALVLAMPDTYQATARVFVDTRTMLSEVTRGISVETNIDTQIQRVRQALLGGPEIEKVAREEFPEFATSIPERRQLLVSKLRDRITITSDSRENATAGTYVITYTDENRLRSEGIVRRLVTAFVEGSRGGNREDTENTRRFLDAQIADTTASLRAAEGRLRDFQTKNFALMLGTKGDYFARQQAEVSELDKDRSALAIKLSQREALRRQLAIEQPVLNGTTDSGVPGAPSSGVAPGNDTASRIRATEAELDSLLLQFTEKHPRVIALRATLEDLKARQREELEAVRRGDPGAAQRFGLGSNPVYQDLMKQLNLTEVEIAALQRSVADHQNKIAELNKVMKTAPEIEAELKDMNRDYDQTLRLYNDLVDKRSRMAVSERAEDTGKKSTFEVIDPARASYVPVAPNRPRLIITVLFAALAAGGGLAYLLYQLKPVFSSARQLGEVTGLPVLGLVNMIWLGRYQAAARRGAIVYAALGTLLLAAAVVIFVVQSEATRIVRTLIS